MDTKIYLLVAFLASFGVNCYYVLVVIPYFKRAVDSWRIVATESLQTVDNLQKLADKAVIASSDAKQALEIIENLNDRLPVLVDKLALSIEDKAKLIAIVTTLINPKKDADRFNKPS